MLGFYSDWFLISESISLLVVRENAEMHYGELFQKANPQFMKPQDLTKEGKKIFRKNVLPIIALN